MTSVPPELRVVAGVLAGRIEARLVLDDPARTDLARAHRVELLIRWAGASSQEQVAAEHARAELVETVRTRALAAVLDRLCEARIDALVFKGAALAHVLYARPFLRSRADVDLLVRRRDVEAAETVLDACGYERSLEPDSDVASGQRHYRSSAPMADAIDLHWRAANPQAFAGLVDFEDAWSRAVPVAPLGPHARTLGLADALLVACAHRIAHHGDEVELLGLWDIHLLVERMDATEAQTFVRLAAGRRMRVVCARSLSLAGDLFGTPVAALIDALSGDRDPVVEPSAAFIGGGRPVDTLASDLRHSANWRVRVRLVREHLFPAFSYMRARYPHCPALLLPIAYPYRILAGAPSWFRRAS